MRERSPTNEATSHCTVFERRVQGRQTLIDDIRTTQCTVFFKQNIDIFIRLEEVVKS